MFQLMNSFGNLLTWSSAPQEFASARVQRTAQSCPAIQHAFEYPDGSVSDVADQPGSLADLLAGHGFEAVEECSSGQPVMQPQQLQKPVSPSKLTLEPSVQQDAGELVLAALWPSKPQASFTASPGSIQDSAQDVLMDSSPSAEPQPEPLAPQGQLLQQHQLQQEQDPWNAVEDAVPSSLLVSEIRDSLEITDCPTLDLNPLLAVELSLPQSPASPTARQLAHVDAVLARSESLLAAADAVMLDAKTRNAGHMADESWTQCQHLELSLSDTEDHDDPPSCSSSGRGQAAPSVLQRQGSAVMKQVRFSSPEVTGEAAAPAWAVLHAQVLTERLAVWQALQPRTPHRHSRSSNRSPRRGSHRGGSQKNPPPTPSQPSRRVLESVRRPPQASEPRRQPSGSPRSLIPGPRGLPERPPLQELSRDGLQNADAARDARHKAASGPAPVQPDSRRRAVVAEFQAAFMAAKQAHAPWLRLHDEPCAVYQARQAASSSRYTKAAEDLLVEMGPGPARAVAHMMHGRWQACEAPLKL